MSQYFSKKSIFTVALIGLFAAACSAPKALEVIQPAQKKSVVGDSVSNTNSTNSTNSANNGSTSSPKNEESIARTGEQSAGQIALKTTSFNGIEMVSIEAVREAQNAGYSNDAIIAQLTSSNFVASAEALSFLGMSKYILAQYGAPVVDGITAIGLPGLERARIAGLKDKEIIAYAKLQGVYFGELALNALGLGKYVLSTHGVQPVEGVNAMGLTALNKARAAGATDSEIITYAKLQGVYFGEQALNALGLGKFVLSTHGVQSVEGVNAMGLTALNKARAAGATDSEIITYAKLQGVYFGEQALNALGLGKFVLSTHGTQIVNGVNSMGLSAVNRARGAGLTDTEIKAYAKLQGVYFGVEALRSLGL